MSATKFLDTNITSRLSRIASAALTQYLLAKINAADHSKCDPVAAANAVCCGVIEDAVASGKEASLANGGRVTLRAGGAIVVNDEIVSDANGKGVARGDLSTVAYNVVGRALTAAADGELFTLEWHPYVIRGALEQVVNKTQADTPVALTAADHGKLFTNLGATGQTTFSLPAAPAAGLRFRFTASAAQEIRVDPGANDAIFINGAKQADGKYITFDDEAELVALVSDANGDWIVIGSAGTITVEA